MLKKAQSISINTIIIAAIALAVLVVLFIIFTGRFKIFSEGVEDANSCYNACRSLGRSGVLYTSDDKIGCNSQNGVYIPGQYKDSSGKICCCQ